MIYQFISSHLLYLLFSDLSMLISGSSSTLACGSIRTHINRGAEHWAMSTTNVFVCLCLCVCVYVQRKSQTRPSLSECSSCLLLYWARMYYLAIFWLCAACVGELRRRRSERESYMRPSNSTDRLDTVNPLNRVTVVSTGSQWPV